MFLLKTVEPSQASGKIAEVYNIFPKEIGVPVPMQLLSASPGLLERQMEFIKYYREHPKLSFQLLASIRYVVAMRAGHKSCEDLNAGMLTRIGLSSEELAELGASKALKSLEEQEAAMFSFVVAAVEKPEEVTADKLDVLRKFGYSDSDILDALSHGANMRTAAITYKAFVRD